MHPLIIGAPFGNYINRPGITSTIGTYTCQKRGNLLKRIWKVLCTVRYYWRFQSWINELGLPNPGIMSLRGWPWNDAQGKILSIHGFTESEWEILSEIACVLKSLMVELNISCPNVTKIAIKEAVRAGEIANKLLGGKVIAKLPPIRWMEYAHPLMAVGINKFHLCNTIDTPGVDLAARS